MKSSGPNVSILHLRSTSEPWINDEGDISPNIKSIFDMDSQNIFKNSEENYSCLKNDFSPLPKRFINNRPKTLMYNRTNRRYFKSKNNCSRNGCQIINLVDKAEPSENFLSEYEEDLEFFILPRKNSEYDFKLNSYYPILAPPPGFQDDIIISKSENIDAFADKINHFHTPDFSNSQIKNNLLNISHQKRLKAAAESDAIRFVDKYHYRSHIATDYLQDEENTDGHKSKIYVEEIEPLKWQLKDDQYSQYTDKCNCNKKDFVPSTFHYNINGRPKNSYPDCSENLEYRPINHSVEPADISQRHKIRRAVSFQNGHDTSTHVNNNDYRSNMRSKNAKRCNARKLSSYDDTMFCEPETDEMLKKQMSSLNSQFSYDNSYAYHYPKCKREIQTEECLCICPNNITRNELFYKKSNNAVISESLQHWKQYEYKCPEKSEIQSLLCNDIHPHVCSNEKNIVEVSNPPDIANVTYSREQNRYLYDPEFIRKQPDILQSAYFGNRISKSPSGHAVINYNPTSYFPMYNNLCIEEVRRKSSSLPKSFQNENVKLQNESKFNDHPALLFYWKKHGLKGLLSNKKVLVPTSVMSETAPTTPVRDMPEKKRYGRLMKVGQYSSTPSLEDNAMQYINFDCDNRCRRNKFKLSKTATLNSSDFHPSSQENIISSTNLGDGVFHKFCKSFSLRFLRKPLDSGNDTHKIEPNHDASVSNRIDSDSNESYKKQTNRFGPLSWRSSKERKVKINTSYENNEEQENEVQSRLQNKEKELTSKFNVHQRLIRRTLSDLNGYCSIVKDKNVNATVPTKYRPPVPAVVKKHKQYNLRRTMSQPLLGSKFSPVLEKKPPPCRSACSEDEKILFSEDDMMSDSGSSLHSRKNSFDQGINEDVVIFAEAVWDHVAIESEELPFNAGDVIEVYNVLDREWWWGMCNGKSGWFPSDFVRLRVNQEETLQNQLTNSPTKQYPSLSIYSNDQVRSKIVCELINTERDFVKILKNVKEAYIMECRNAKELFTLDQIYKIFGNWEQISSFQSMFSDNLEINLDTQTPYKTCVGESFLKFKDYFRMYSDYCNNHPLSIATLQQLYQQAEYRNFFEKCRIKRNLIELPLDGFLLTPIQRICKYPLQLAELLKYTEDNHSDYNLVKNALNAMREVAVLINERKRRMESLEKLILWQQRVEGWEGNNLIEGSSQLIHQNDVTKVFAGFWCTNVTLFLFDHQLMFCKKDIIKRDYFVYKGRISLDDCDVIDIADGKDTLLGINVRHGIRIQNAEKKKWLLFCCRTHKEKLEWLDAFRKEKELVLADERTKLQITPMDRHLAYITATTCNTRHVFLKHKNKKLKRSFHGNGHISRNMGSSHILGRKVGTWFMFGANRKNHPRINTKNNVNAI